MPTATGAARPFSRRPRLLPVVGAGHEPGGHEPHSVGVLDQRRHRWVDGAVVMNAPGDGMLLPASGMDPRPAPFLASMPRGGAEMVHDDDIGRRIHFDIEYDDPPPPHVQRTDLPSVATQEQIVELGQRFGWDVDRIYTYLRDEVDRHDITRAMIRQVLEPPRVR